MLFYNTLLDFFYTLLRIENCLIKNLTKRKPNGKKNLVKEKRVQCVLTPAHECITLSL